MHPAENPLLVGHEKAEEQFYRAWEQDRLHHAWLITGVKGIGKSTLAYRMARFLLQGGPEEAQAEDGLFGDDLPEDNPKGASLSVDEETVLFNRVAQGAHGGLLVIAPEEDKQVIAVDQVREVNHFLQHTAAESPWRIVIVDEADRMNQNAANALLKILEEPPKQSIIFLVSHTPAGLLPTIKSRCQQLPLAPLSEEKMETLFAEMGRDISPLALRLAYGSPGMAMQLNDSLSDTYFASICDLLAGMPNVPASQMQQFSEQVSGKRQEKHWPVFFFLLQALLHEAAKVGVQTKALSGREEQAAVQALCRAYSPTQLADYWKQSLSLEREINGLYMDKKMGIFNFLTHMQQSASAT